MQQEKRLLKNTLIYAIGNFGSKILSFLLVPLFSFYLTKAEFGNYDITVITASLLVPFVTFQLSDGTYRWLLDMKDNNRQSEIKSIISSSGLILVINVFIALCVFLMLRIFFFKQIEHSLLLINYFLSLCLLPYFQQIARGLQKNKLYATAGVLNSLILVVCNLTFLMIFNWGIKALFLSMAISNYIVIALLIIKVNYFKYFSIASFNKKMVLELIKYSVPLIPNIISWWMISSANRYIILNYLGDEANGVFAMGVRITAVLVMVNSIFSLAWQESAITEYDSTNRDSFYTKIFKYYFRFQMIAIIILLPITKLLIINFVDKSFIEAWKYTPFLYVGVAFSAFSAFLGTGYLSTKNTMGAFYTTIFGSAANLIVTFSLVHFVGLYSAAIGSMCGFLLTWLLRIYQTKKYFVISFDVKDFIYLFLLLIGSSLSIMCTEGNMLLLILTFILVIICVVSYKNDIKLVTEFVSKKIKKNNS